MNPLTIRERRRHHFNGIAALYDAIRPRYPAPLYTALACRAGLSVDTPLVEIGGGTGIATLPLAEKGFPITVIEPGAALLAIAQEKLQPYPNVRFVQADFKDYRHQGPAPRLVYAAQSFHWVRPELRYTQTRSLLAPGGWLAIMANYEKVCSPYIRLSRPAYAERYGPGDPPTVTARLEEMCAELRGSGCYGPPQVVRVPWDVEHTTARVLQLLESYSDTRTAGDAVAERFLAHIARLIDGVGGVVRMEHEAVLIMAQRR